MQSRLYSLYGGEVGERPNHPLRLLIPWIYFLIYLFHQKVRLCQQHMNTAEFIMKWKKWWKFSFDEFNLPYAWLNLLSIKSIFKHESHLDVRFKSNDSHSDCHNVPLPLIPPPPLWRADLDGLRGWIGNIFACEQLTYVYILVRSATGNPLSK